MDINKKVITDVEIFLRKNDMSRYKFCTSINKNDHNLLNRIEQGKAVTVKTIDKIYDFMKKYN